MSHYFSTALLPASSSPSYDSRQKRSKGGKNAPDNMNAKQGGKKLHSKLSGVLMAAQFNSSKLRDPLVIIIGLLLSTVNMISTSHFSVHILLLHHYRSNLAHISGFVQFSHWTVQNFNASKKEY